MKKISMGMMLSSLLVIQIGCGEEAPVAPAPDPSAMMHSAPGGGAPIHDAVDATKEAATDAIDATKEAATDAIDATKEAATDAIDATKEAATDAVDAAKEVAPE